MNARSSFSAGAFVRVITAFACALVLTSGPAATPARAIVLDRRGTDRPFPIDWCPCETRGSSSDGPNAVFFTPPAGVTEVDLVFELASTREGQPSGMRIDNLAITTGEPGSSFAVTPGYEPCYDGHQQAPSLMIDAVTPHFLVDRLEAPGPEWTLSGCASFSATQGAPTDTRTGAGLGSGCLRLSNSTTNATLVSARRRVSGLTPGVTYQLTYWWAMDGAVPGRLSLTIETPPPPAAALVGWTLASSCAVAEVRPIEALAWTDWDGDGAPDLLYGTSAAYVGEPDLNGTRTAQAATGVLRGDGDGNFTATSGPPTLGGEFYGGLSVADCDRDGDPDVLMTGGASLGAPPSFADRVGAWTMLPGGLFLKSFSASAHGFAGSWADYDRDGALDLFVDAYAHLLMRQSAPAQFTMSTPPSLSSPNSTEAGFASWSDVDDDGWMDLVLPSGDRVRWFRNLHNGDFAPPVALDGALAVAPKPLDIAWGDFDGDGDLDLYVVSGDCLVGNRLLRNLGNGVFADATPPELACLCTGGNAQWGDFDQDGALDLLLAVATGGGGPRLFHNNGDGVHFTEITPAAWAAYGAMHAVALADVDRDGDLDAAFAPVGDDDPYTTPFEVLRILRNAQSTGRHWLEIELRGVTSNRDAIGARIRAYAGGHVQVREVTSGVGGVAQNERRLHFGLGAAGVVDSLVVRWPNGTLQRWRGLVADRRLLLSEDAVTAVDTSVPAPRDFALAAVAPNPVRTSSTIAYALPRAGSVRLRLHDLAGRTIREWNEAHETGGSFQMPWDGTDSEGRRVAGGVYFLRMECGEFHATRRVIVVR